MPTKITTTCPYCRVRLSVASEKAGLRLKCPKCKGDVYVQLRDDPIEPPSLPSDEKHQIKDESITSLRSITDAFMPMQHSAVKKKAVWRTWRRVVFIIGTILTIWLTWLWIMPRQISTEINANKPLNAGPDVGVSSEQVQILEDAINVLIEAGNSETRVTCSLYAENLVWIEVDGMECYGIATYSEGKLVAVKYLFPLSGLMIQDMKAGLADFQEFIRVFYASFSLLCSDHGQDYNMANTLLSWMGPDPIKFLANQTSRSFGSRIVAGIDNEKGLSVFYATTLVTQQTLQVAQEATQKELIKAMEKAESAKTWQDMQTALRGTEGYCTRPDLGSITAGRISIGDSMLDVAGRLSIHGSEVSNFEGRTFQVKWQDETGMILLTFEKGRVTQKMSF